MAGASHPPYRFAVDSYVILQNGQDRSLRFVGKIHESPVYTINGQLPPSRFRSTAPSMRERIRFPYYYAVLIFSARNRHWRRVCAGSVYLKVPAA